MKRKITAIVLSICILLCFASCEGTKTEVHIDNNIDNNIDNEIQQGDSDIDIQETPNEPESTTEEKTPVKEEPTKKQETATKQPPKTDTNVSAHVHSYSNATCTQPRYCSCGATIGSSLGHSFSNATCTSPKMCSRCGATSGSALGHNYSNATCTTAKKCSRCGATSGSALGHNYVNNRCSRCGKTNPNSLPVGLHNLHIISSSSNYKYDNTAFEDTYGNIYSGVHMFGYQFSRESYATFNLGQQYKTFSGSIVPAPKLEDITYVDYYIYVDDELVYTKTKQERITAKIDFKIDVSGGTTLTIKVKPYLKPGITATGYLGMGTIVNAQLTK